MAAPAPRKTHKLARTVLAAVAGLIVAVVLVSMFLSRQKLKASQSRIRVLPASSAAPQPVAKPAPTRPQPAAVEARTPKPEEKEKDAKDAEVNAEASAKQVLNGPVRTLWESGRYSQAMALVDRILSDNPADEAALAWKRKIREAQAAEAALK